MLLQKNNYIIKISFIILIYGVFQIKSDLFPGIKPITTIIGNVGTALGPAPALPKLIVCPPDKCGGKTYGQQTLAAGGTEAYEKFYAGLFLTMKDNTKAFCGGSLIDTSKLQCHYKPNKYILTAAHCLENATYVTIVLGKNDYSDYSASSYVGTCNATATGSHIIYHKDWTMENFRNDIGLLEIVDPSQIDCINENSRTIAPVLLPPGPQELDDKIFTMTGRGIRFFFSTSIEGVARCVTLPYLSYELCSQFLDTPTKQFCVGCLTRAACSGDSGTGVVYLYTVYGIISAGYNPCDIGLPTICTQVDRFLDWIKASACFPI